MIGVCNVLSTPVVFSIHLEPSRGVGHGSTQPFVRRPIDQVPAPTTFQPGTAPLPLDSPRGLGRRLGPPLAMVVNEPVLVLTTRTLLLPQSATNTLPPAAAMPEGSLRVPSVALALSPAPAV